MSAPGLDRVDVDVLAADGASLTRRYPIERFARLVDVLAGAGGEVVATFVFARLAEGLAGCELGLSARLTLKCQRCLEPYGQPLHSTTKLAFVAGDDDAGLVPEGFDAVPADDGRVDLGELVEDELLLSLPVVALHGEGTQCAGSARQAADEMGARPEADTHRPFAQLQDLLKH
jgi:uncharacterized protein